MVNELNVCRCLDVFYLFKRIPVGLPGGLSAMINVSPSDTDCLD